MLDTRVIAMRLQKLDSYQQSLRQLQKVSRDDYLQDDNIQAVVERKLQLSIQVCIDIANYLIAQLGLRAPEQLENVFLVLGREGILSQELAQRMVGMVRFRNILVHNYLDTDADIVYNHLQKGLPDFEQFALEVVNRFLS